MSSRSVLSTGAGRGIGGAIARRLAGSGRWVYAGLRTDVAAKRLAEESELVMPVELDVTVPAHLTALDRELSGRLDALVNNAGIGVGGPGETLSRAEDAPPARREPGRAARCDPHCVAPAAPCARPSGVHLLHQRPGVVPLHPGSTTPPTTRPRPGPWPTAYGWSCGPSASKSLSLRQGSSTPTMARDGPAALRPRSGPRTRAPGARCATLRRRTPAGQQDPQERQAGRPSRRRRRAPAEPAANAAPHPSRDGRSRDPGDEGPASCPRPRRGLEPRHRGPGKSSRP
jgi:hypothetical protein